MRVILLMALIAILSGCTDSQTADPQSVSYLPGKHLWAVDWHPTKDQCVVGGSLDSVCVISTDDQRILESFPFLGTITKTKWHPTANKVAVSVQDGLSAPSILNLDTRQLTELDSICPAGARAIGWNQPGDLLAVGDYDGYLIIFDSTGTFLRKINTHQKGLIGLEWHPEENLVVAVGEKITWYHLDLDSLSTIEDRPEEILMLCVGWHPDGKLFVTGDYGDNTIPYPALLQYWSYDGQLLHSIEESQAECRNLTWSNDGELLATASEKVRLWNREGEVVRAEESEALLWGIDWKKDGSQLVATDVEGRVLFWDRELRRVNLGEN